MDISKNILVRVLSSIPEEKADRFDAFRRAGAKLETTKDKQKLNILHHYLLSSSMPEADVIQSLIDEYSVSPFETSINGTTTPICTLRNN